MKVQVSQMVIAIGAQMISPARKLFLSRVATGNLAVLCGHRFLMISISVVDRPVRRPFTLVRRPKLPEFGASHNMLRRDGRGVTGLFHRDRFRQVARLVDIGAHEHGGVIGEQLDRQREEHRAMNASTSGSVIVAMVGSCRMPPRPCSSVMKTIWPPRAATSSMLETVLSKKRS